MKLDSAVHKYRITFPGGEIIYLPLDRLIIDPVKKKSISLPEPWKFSLLSHHKTQNKTSSSDYRPICLTVLASHLCNLNCTYCYIPEKDEYPVEFIDPAVVESGAKIVAENCKRRNRPFVVGFHGGNEPLLHPETIETYLGICEKVAKNANLEFLSFCTTNGVIPEETARWAAGKFFGITLSWDGPPEVHNNFRKDRFNGITGENVEKSARIFIHSRKGPGPFLIRCTITNSSVEKMVEIIRYFKISGAKSVEFYPVFQNRMQTLSEEIIPDPVKFVYYFLQARSYGNTHDIEVLFSGSRINDHHSRYCMILQDNLAITPDGYLTNCYHHTQNYNQQESLFFYGKYHQETRQLEYDHKKLGQIIDTYDTRLTVCSDCFNQFHCSIGCPEVCPFGDQYHPAVQPDCIKEKWLGLAGILEVTGYLKKFPDESAFNDFFHHISYERI